MTTPSRDPAYLDNDHDHVWELFALHIGQMIGVDATHTDVQWRCQRCGRLRSERMGVTHLSITIETVKEGKHGKDTR